VDQRPEAEVAQPTPGGWGVQLPGGGERAQSSARPGARPAS